MMLIENIEYTAMLVSYTSRMIGMDTSKVAQQIGPTGIARIAHNAPMNRILPIKKIAHEIIHDYEIPGISHQVDLSETDKDFAKKVRDTVSSKTEDHHRFAEILFETLVY